MATFEQLRDQNRTNTLKLKGIYTITPEHLNQCQQIKNVHVLNVTVGKKNKPKKQNKTKQNKTKQNKTKQNKTKQNKTKKPQYHIYPSMAEMLGLVLKCNECPLY